MTEYICVSCWTSFEVTTSTESDVLCPHCGFEQPAVDEYLADENAADAPLAEPVEDEDGGEAQSEQTAPEQAATEVETEASVEAAPVDDEEGEETVEEAEENGEEAEELGLEPISFDDLDELDSADEEKSQAEPPPESTESESNPADVTEAENPEKGGAESEPPAVVHPIAWQFKGIHGMTYRFLDVKALVKWTTKLNDISSCLVSKDGASWKMLQPFLQHLEEGSDPMAAFTQTAALASASPETPAAEGDDSQKPSRTQSVAKQRRTATSGGGGKGSASAARKSRTNHTRRMDRSRTSHGGSRRTATSMARTRTSTTGTMRSPRSAELTGIPDWKNRIIYLSAGLVVGGLAVYFGMYFMGFYDLAF